MTFSHKLLLSRSALCVLSALALYLLYVLFSSTFSAEYNKPTRRMLDVYQAQIKERREYFDRIKHAEEFLQWGYLYNNLAPEVYCAENVKIGTTDDGGKWFCSPFNLPEGCTIFALGISNSITFESHIQKLTNQRCRIISVDANEQSDETLEALKNVNAEVVKAMISPEDTENTRSMKSILEERGVDEIEILKIDIEGAEFSTMKRFLDQYTVSQIMIEIHGTATDVLDLLRVISDRGYLLYHYEINGRYHNLCEYAFIHETRLEQYGATYLAKYINIPK